MYSWRYLLLGVPSAGLLGPAALSWSLGKFHWGRALLSLGLALPLWLLAAWQPYLWSAGLWFLGLVALNAWIAGDLRDPGAWLRSAGLVGAHLLLAVGIALLGVGAFLGDQVRSTLPYRQLIALGAGMGIVGLG
ncbi:MAG: competence protein, partial [Meiothermus silvanus]|nr:competence protein [Allomeiothermus silvanus]